MSKSATEQFQIKKKRKNRYSHNNSSSSNNNNSHYNNNYKSSSSSSSSNNKLTTKTALAIAAYRQQQQKYSNNNNNSKNVDTASAHLAHYVVDDAFRVGNYFTHTPAPLLIENYIADNIDDDSNCVCVCDIEDCCVRDSKQATTKLYKKMPLSQGFYAKGALATKRSLKAFKVCGRDEAKRKINDNFSLVGNNTNSNNNNNMKINNASNNFIAKMLPRKLPKAPTHILPHNLEFIQQHHQQQQQHEQQLRQRINAQYSNNLQLCYMLGEQCARYGHLQDAFNMYAYIASQQPDGCIPLERLNTLANSLIDYVRQLASGSGKANIAAAAPLDGVGDLETMLRAKYAAAANWHLTASAEGGNSAAVAAANIPDTVLDASMDLHAPTRELRIPNPVESCAEDYDPLMCPLCRDILRCPVTANCGHTFCRQCCDTITMCNICHIKFPRHIADDFVSDANVATTSMAAQSAATTSAAASTAAYYDGMLARDNRQQAQSSGDSFFAANSSASNNYSNSNRLRLLIAPTAAAAAGAAIAATPTHNVFHTTVTTTTVASTTATTTTTMASSTSSLGIVGSSVASGSSTGAAVNTANNMKFMPDVLVRRLVEKWWGPELQAKKINETAASYMHLNLLDDALKFCNASLEKSPTNFKSLLLRAEVLRKLNHFQSSLADIDNALKSRNTSAKAHYMRALALSELGRYDDALYANCLAISLDKTTQLSTSELFKHDLVKILQKLLTQALRNRSSRVYATSAPYSIQTGQRLRRKQIALLSNANGDHFSAYDDDDDDFVVDCAPACDYITDVVVDDDDVAVGVHAEEDENDVAAVVAGAKNFKLELRRRTARKHFRRKTKELELLATTPFDMRDAQCCIVFRSILERTQQELLRLKKLEAAGDAGVQKQQQQQQVAANLIDASDFDCVLCFRTFWKPVVTPCGHTYCWVCLDRCMDYKSSCPLCMSPLVEPNVNMYQGSSSPVPFTLAKRPVTKFLEAAMKRFIPDSYEKRFRQEIDMEPSVPVFICTTAFPYVPCPLFVYEPRYRLMVRRAVESGDKQFGIVQPQSGKSRYYDVGTILDIRDCVLLGDGCSILSTIGCKRFKILARNEKDGYETAKVEYIYDELIADENVKFVSNMHATVLRKAIDWFESLSTEFKQSILQSFGEMPAVEENWESVADGPAWAWWIIALLPLNQKLKVTILATTSLEKRLRAIEKTLDYLCGRLQRAPQNCNVVAVQEQQQTHHHHHHHHHQQQQENEYDAELTQTCQNDVECCQHTATANSSDARNASSSASTQFLL